MRHMIKVIQIVPIDSLYIHPVSMVTSNLGIHILCVLIISMFPLEMNRITIMVACALLGILFLNPFIP